MLALTLVGLKLWAGDAAVMPKRSVTAKAPVMVVVEAVAPAPPHQAWPMEGYKKTDAVGGPTEPIGPLARCPQLQRMVENHTLRWPHVRRVCAVVAVQLLMTAAAVALFTSFESMLLSHREYGFALYIVSLIASHALMILLLRLRHCSTINLLVLALYTLCITPLVAMSTVLIDIDGKEGLIFGIFSAIVVVVYTACTLWVSVPGRCPGNCSSFRLLCLILLTILAIYLIFQILFLSCSEFLATVYAVVATLTFTGLLTVDMGNLATGHMQDDYVLVAMNIYLDVVNLFVSLLSFGASWPAACVWGHCFNSAMNDVDVIRWMLFFLYHRVESKNPSRHSTNAS